MMDNHPDRDLLEDHPDKTHQAEDHLKDCQGIQIHGYHAFPEGGHHQEDLHKGCHHQHLQTIRNQQWIQIQQENQDLRHTYMGQEQQNYPGMAQ